MTAFDQSRFRDFLTPCKPSAPVLASRNSLHSIQFLSLHSSSLPMIYDARTHACHRQSWAWIGAGRHVQGELLDTSLLLACSHSSLKDSALSLQSTSCRSLKCREISVSHLSSLVSTASIHGLEASKVSLQSTCTRRRQIPAAMFGGLFGKWAAEKVQEEEEDTVAQEAKYHSTVPLPFPMQLLDSTFLEGRDLLCCYKASLDGFGASAFHARCDFKGPVVIVCTTDNGLRFGAFNPEGYRSTDDYYDSFDAFLFYWVEVAMSTTDLPIVLRKVGGSGAALFDYARGGPQFGADGLLVGAPLAPVMGGFAGPDTNSGAGELTKARSRLGLSYEKRPDGKDSLFGDDRSVTVKEVEVFCCPKIAKLYK
eukprot:TRINITY_DN21078_c0_g1_i1.p1 TRINITY_DN21078_c0_g1~~TRINITY_DN21078_c0_g1_i1.p1  ORF type:complete len:367 (-),score=28.23 TRINITY_DN21078_c0_g1_i1:325-1425(-)